MGDNLAERLRTLEDRHQIEELRATYCFLVDDGRFDELVNEWFTEDAVCDFRGVRESSASPRFVSQGHAEVRSFFTQVVAAMLQDMCHTTHNHRMVIDGDRASGDCYFELTAKHPPTGDAVVGAGRYIDRYRRVGGRWRLERRNAEIFYMAPLPPGWAKRPFVDLPADTPSAEG